MERKALTLKLDEGGAETGAVAAVFSTFNTVDRDGDVTLPTAFTDGAPVRIASWGHKWADLPVGKGTVRVTPEAAVLEGQFFLDTEAGRETYRTVKNLGDLQEWSYGFEVLESESGEFDGQPVRFLKRVQVFEVSPVLLGAGVNTRTLAIKEAKRAIPPHGGDTAPEDAPWDGPAAVREAPNEAAVLRRMHAWVDPEGDPDAKSSYKLPHHRPDGTVVWRGVAAAMTALLGGRGGVDIPESDRRGVYNHLSRHYGQFDKEPPEFRDGLTYVDHAEQVLADLQAFVGRTKDLASLRAKEGRVLSAANRDRLSRLLSSMREAMADLEELLTSTDPEQPKAREEALKLWADFQRIQARLSGVAV